VSFNEIIKESFMDAQSQPTAQVIAFPIRKTTTPALLARIDVSLIELEIIQALRQQQPKRVLAYTVRLCGIDFFNEIMAEMGGAI
jgi:hypothetical protein